MSGSTNVRHDRKDYTDEQRAAAVAALTAEGYPERRGALQAVTTRLGIHKSVLRRWFNGSQNPPSEEKLAVATQSLKEMLEEYVRLALPTAIDFLDDETKMRRTPIKDLMVSIAVCVDKIQLLSGQPTEIVESTWKDKARENGIPEEVVRAHALKRLSSSQHLGTRPS